MRKEKRTERTEEFPSLIQVFERVIYSRMNTHSLRACFNTFYHLDWCDFDWSEKESSYAQLALLQRAFNLSKAPKIEVQLKT